MTYAALLPIPGFRLPAHTTQTNSLYFVLQPALPSNPPFHAIGRSNMFKGVRFVLAGFDPVSAAQYRMELVNAGAVDVGSYDSSCTHAIVHGVAYDDPLCVAARSDGKILVTNFWVEDSLDIGSPADASRILYSPVRDLRGISGADSLYICLTGYQGKDRDGIMKMVTLMGAHFSKPLIASKVTHLICYKFEGEKYELAKKTKIKLVNHQWLEDCLKAWEILPEDRYNKSSWELEVMEAEARDSEEEVEMGASGFSNAQSCFLTPHRLGLSKSVKDMSKSPQNSVFVKGSLHIGEDVLLNNKLSSPADKVANLDRAAIADLAKINFQESGHQGAGTKPEARKDNFLIDGTMGKVIPILANKSSDLTKSDITNEASKPSSSTGTVDRSLHPDASKFFKLSFSRKTPRKAVFSMVSHLSSHLHSSPPAQSEVKLVKDVFCNSSPKKAKSKFSSGEIQSAMAETEMRYAEGQETTPQKSKNAICGVGFSSMETSMAFPFTTTRSSDAPITSNDLHLGSCLGNDKNPLEFISTDSASNQRTETARIKSSSHGRKFLKCRQPVLKTQTSNNAALSSSGELINLPCDIESQIALGKPMDVNNTRKCSGVRATENGRVVEPEAQNRLGYLRTKLDNRYDESDILIRRLINHQESEIGEVRELQHDSDVSLSKRTKCESNKSQTTAEMNTVKDGNAKAPSSGCAKTKGKRKVNHMPKLVEGNHTKGKSPVFLGKANTSNEATLNSENSKDQPDTEKTSGMKNNMTGSTSDAEVFTEEVKGTSLPLNRTKDAAVVEALLDTEKENKPEASMSQRRNLSKRLSKKGTFKSKRISMKSKEAVTRSNSAEPQACKCSVSSSAEPVWFILSGHRLQRKEFQQIIRRLKGRLCRDSHQWSYQATHLIVPNPIKRTEKFFAAASAGRWILKADYLTASSQAGGFVAEEPFEWHMSSLSEDGAINLEAPRRWRLLRQRTGHGAFHRMQIVIYGDCIAPSLDTMKRVVKAGGGSILATSPPYDRFLKSGVDFAVISPVTPSVDCWVQQFLRHEIPCILADYLVEYVCKPGYSLDRHVLYNTQAWAEKSFARMSARLEEVTDSGTPLEELHEDHD